MKFSVDNNLTFKDHVRMAEIEMEYYSSEYLCTPELTWAYYCRNKDTYICIRDMASGEIAAFLSLIPVDDEIFNLILSGDFIDSYIDADRILKYDTLGKYKLHLDSVAIAGGYKKSNLICVIYRELKRKIADLSLRNITFTDVTADCVSEDGAALCEKLLNMKCVKLTPRNSKIYWGDCSFK